MLDSQHLLMACLRFYRALVARYLSVGDLVRGLSITCRTLLFELHRPSVWRSFSLLNLRQLPDSLSFTQVRNTRTPYRHRGHQYYSEDKKLLLLLSGSIVFDIQAIIFFEKYAGIQFKIHQLMMFFSDRRWNDPFSRFFC